MAILKEWTAKQLKRLRRSKIKRSRDGIYEFLTEVYELWTELDRQEGRPARIRSMLASLDKDRAIAPQAPPLRGLLDLVTPAPRQQRSKWYCALEYAWQVGWSSEELTQKMKDEGGINACAASLAKLRNRSKGTAGKTPRPRSSSKAW